MAEPAFKAGASLMQLNMPRPSTIVQPFKFSLKKKLRFQRVINKIGDKSLTFQPIQRNAEIRLSDMPNEVVLITVVAPSSMFGA